MKIKVCSLSDLKERDVKTARVLARRIAVVRLGEEIYAFEADCKHMKQSLAGGKIEGKIITCPAHGWRYDVTSGECLTESWARLKTFEIVVEDGVVFVEV